MLQLQNLSYQTEHSQHKLLIHTGFYISTASIRGKGRLVTRLEGPEGSRGIALLIRDVGRRRVG
jgi:hypothetical protein